MTVQKRADEHIKLHRPEFPSLAAGGGSPPSSLMGTAQGQIIITGPLPYLGTWLNRGALNSVLQSTAATVQWSTGTINLGGFNATLPESMTLAGRNVTNQFTATQSIRVTNLQAFLVENAGGTDIFYVDTTNYMVGINIVSPPSAALHVTTFDGIPSEGIPVDDADIVGIFSRNKFFADGASLAIIAGTSGMARLEFGDKDTFHDAGFDYSLGLQYLDVYTASTAWVRITSTGYVGINTTTPDARLESLDAAAVQLRLTHTDGVNYADFQVGAAGTLTVAPTGDFIFNPTGNDVYPQSNYDLNLGLLTNKWLTLHAAELWVETLVAQDTIATIGGRILVGPTTILTSDVAPADVVIWVKHNEMAAGDRVYLEADGKVEFMSINGAPGGVGPYSYAVTRNLDGSGANQWYAGDAVFNTGTVGEGFIDLYSVHGIKAGTEIGPTIVGNVRNSATFNDWSPYWAIGNLNGLFGYAVDTYGTAFGKYSSGVGVTSSYITVDATNGIRIFSRDNITSIQRAQWDIAGNILIGQVAASQNNIYISAGVISIRNNAVERIGMTAAGILTIKDSGGNAVFTFNAALGAEFTLPLTIAATGGIYQGTGTFAVPTTGLKLWNDGGIGRLAGYNAGIIQTYFGTDGILYAGAGDVYLDSSGISLTQDTGDPIDRSKSVSFVSGANVMASIGSWRYTFIGETDDILNLYITDTSTRGGMARVKVGAVDVALIGDAPTGLGASHTVEGITILHGGLNVGTGLTIISGGINTTGDVRIGAGLYVGADTDPAADQIWTDGSIYIYGDHTNAFMTLGLTIDQKDNDDEALALKSTDVAHGITTLAETDTYAQFFKVSGDEGGLWVRGFRDTNTTGLILTGIGPTDNTTKSTAGYGYVIIQAQKNNVTTVQDCGADANLLTIHNNATTRFIFDAEGEAFSDVAWSNFDEYDDLKLLDKFESSMIINEFGDWLDQDKREMEHLGLAHFDDVPGHAMVNWTRLTELLVGVARQLGRRMAAIESKQTMDKLAN